MRVSLTSLADLATLPFDDIIDVRAPSEFAEDHLTGAISLPVLSDAERARVGTIYVQEDRFLARKIGAALVARNAATHIETALSDRDGGWRPLVYCWRGGQRSGSFASILEQIGWRVGLIDGGYKSYRRLVVEMLYDRDLPQRIVLIGGGTGTGKTDLLGHLRDQGAQVIDLEALANHRGSLFGETGTAQPAQKMFESRLAHQLAGMSPDRPVFVEAESRKVGQIVLPPSLWKAMRGAQMVSLNAPLGARARYLATLYGPHWQDPEILLPRLAALQPYHARSQIDAWQELGKSGKLETLVAELIATHYDPRYGAPSDDTAVEIALKDVSEAALKRAAQDISDRFEN